MKPMDYQIWHQAPGPNDEGTTVRLDQVGSEADETFPSDVVKNPNRYGAEYDSTRRQLQQARGNPDAQIQVWRAVHGHSATQGPRLLAAGFPSPATDAVRSNPTSAATAVSRHTSPARTCNVER